jgi:hypothetical protein
VTKHFFTIYYFCYILKSIFLATLVLSTVLFSACEQDGFNVSFNLDYSKEFTIESALVTELGLPIDVTTPAINTNSSEEFTTNNTSIDRLENAELTSLKLTIIAPDGQKFSFVEEVKLYIQGQGMTEELVASKVNIDDAASEIEMDVESTNLVEHVKSGEFTLRASVTTDELITEDVDVKADMTFKVTAEVL